MSVDIVRNWYQSSYQIYKSKAQRKYPNEEMIRFLGRNLFSIPMSERSNIRVLDLGCGNGWVVKKFSNNNICDLSAGVDGAKNMIDKAKINDSIGQYFQSNIESWSTKDKFDIVFSMETFYYLKNINIVLSNIYNNFLKNKSMLIIGIDHYFENKPSLSWENEI